MRWRGRNVPSTRRGRARGRRPARVGHGGGSSGRTRSGLRAGGAGGGGLEIARNAVRGETCGTLLGLHARIRLPRAVSGRGSWCKRDGGARRVRGGGSRRGVVSWSLVVGGPVGGALLARVPVARERQAHESGRDAREGQCHDDEHEPADPHDAEDTDIGEHRGQGGENHQSAADDGDVEAPLDGLFDVNTAVLSLGQEQPGQPVGEDNERHEERGDHHEDAHERQVPPLVGGDSRADAADDARLRAVPSRAAHGLKEPVAGRALLVLITRICCAIRPTHHALPLDGIHAAWIDTTTQPKNGGSATVGDPLNDP